MLHHDKKLVLSNFWPSIQLKLLVGLGLIPAWITPAVFADDTPSLPTVQNPTVSSMQTQGTEGENFFWFKKGDKWSVQTPRNMDPVLKDSFVVLKTEIGDDGSHSAIVKRISYGDGVRLVEGYLKFIMDDGGIAKYKLDGLDSEPVFVGMLIAFPIKVGTKWGSFGLPRRKNYVIEEVGLHLTVDGKNYRDCIRVVDRGTEKACNDPKLPLKARKECLQDFGPDVKEGDLAQGIQEFCRGVGFVRNSTRFSARFLKKNNAQTITIFERVSSNL